MRKPPPRDLLYVTAQLVVFAAFLADVPALRFPAPTYLRWFGEALAVVGAGYALVAVLQLRTSLTPWPTPRPGGGAGLLLAALGLALRFASGYYLILFLALYWLFWAKSQYEERLLRRAYPGYRRTTQPAPRVPAAVVATIR